jgi:hypothetical protein
MNELKVEVQALDPGFGYNVIALGIVAGARERLVEHYATEAEVATRLGTIWTWWSSQVNSE